MNGLKVNSGRTFRNTLLTAKEIEFADKRFHTPIKAVDPTAVEEGEELDSAAREIDEIHIELSTGDIDLLNSTNRISLAEVHDGIITEFEGNRTRLATLEFTGRKVYSEEELTTVLNEIASHFDVLGGPYMTEQLDTVELDENITPFIRYCQNIEHFHGAYRRAEEHMVRLGGLPVLSWDRVEKLLEIHLEYGVDGLSVDFMGKKPTAKSRVGSIISPLMQKLGEDGLHRVSILHAFNAYRGDNRSDGPRSPAEDFYSFGLGFDILGSLRYRPTTYYPAQDGEKRFRLFDRESYEQRYVNVSSLASNLPTHTELDHSGILSSSRNDDLSRVQYLLEVEQMNIALADLRDALGDGKSSDYIMEKEGTSNTLQEQMNRTRESYDEGTSNPSLASF